MFSRDKAIAYGSVDMRSILELGAISPSKDINTRYKTVAEIDSIFEPETKAKENARCLLYLALRDACNGSMFYDKDKGKIACKVNGRWEYLVIEHQISYDRPESHRK